jgi:hypothetical protein
MEKLSVIRKFVAKPLRVHGYGQVPPSDKP